MNRYYGVAIGIVVSREDPDNQGRLQLEFPWMEQSYRSGWAPIAVPMAGGRRGMYFMPEEGDEVLVAFEHGNVDHPFVVGFLWNGVDLPPDDSIDFSVRRLRTVSGHRMEFDDRDGDESILIETKNGHHIEMVDTPGSITVLTKGGQTLELKDDSVSATLKTKAGVKLELTDMTSKATLSTPSGVSLTLDGVAQTVSIQNQIGNSVEIGPAGITVNAVAGTTNVNCLSATVTASGAMNFVTPLATFAGVVQCITLISTSVVSSSYTPGAGNIW